MTIAAELKKVGLDATGDPAKVIVGLGDAEVSVTVSEEGSRTALRAEVAAGSARMGDLTGASLGAAGDTRFEQAGGSLVGTRSLVDPSPGQLYDAIHELAKATFSVVRLLSDLAELAATDLAGETLQAGAAPEAVATQTMPAARGWTPTHVAPQGGLPAWVAPDPSVAAAVTLDAGLDLEVAERAGDWARVVASNGWTGWVDGRRLVAR